MALLLPVKYVQVAGVNKKRQGKALTQLIVS